MPNCALSEHRMMSHAATNPAPAPSAGPFTAAITGLAHSWIALKHSRAPRLNFQYSPGTSGFGRSFMSAPAENIFPVPVRIATRTSSRSVRESNSPIISSRNAWFCAFTGGRSMTNVATKFSTVSLTAPAMRMPPAPRFLLRMIGRFTLGGEFLAGKEARVSIFDHDLDRTAANHVPLSPVSFLIRAAHVYGPRVAVIHGERRITYAQFLDRSRRLASALARAGVGKGDTVAIMAPNVPEMLEAHNGVPMLGAVLCPINFRLDAGSIAFILQHSEAKVLLTDCEFSPVVAQALTVLDRKPLVIDIDDALAVCGEHL